MPPIPKTRRYSNRVLLAFEAGVLAREKFESVAIPFAGNAKIDWYLKLWGKRVTSNDICQWAWITARARVENNNEQLGEYDLEIILKDVDETHEELHNPALERWFAQSDARWLDKIRNNINKLDNDLVRSLALMAGLLTGDYILAFDSDTEFLRRPLNEIYAEMLNQVNQVIDNQTFNRSANMEANDFIVRTKADLLYANLPAPGSMLTFLEGRSCWREAWVRGHGRIYEELFPMVKSSFSGMVSSKEQYVYILNEMLEKSKHLPLWAIGFADGQPLTMEEMSAAIKKHRPINATYNKDFSDIIGGRNAFIIMAKG